jgi:topoisomerase-4 subunit A
MERKENLTINIEEFISVKGSSAMGNQLTKDKVLEINALDPLPYEVPEDHDTLDIEVVDEENIIPEKKDSPSKSKKENNQANSKDNPGKKDGDGQTKLF